MSTINQMIQSLKTPAAEEQLLRLYGSRPGQLAAQQARYASVLERLAQMPARRGRSGWSARRAAPRSAATTPTTTGAACWPPRSTWTPSPP